MKKILAAIVWLASVSISPVVMADAGAQCHFHGRKPAKEATVVQCGNQQKDGLVETGRLDASWRNVKLDTIDQIDGKKGKEWRLIYKNPAVTDPSKQTLYLFFSLPGNYIAANYTGE